MALLIDHTHDFDLEVSKSKFEIALFQEWEGLERKGSMHIARARCESQQAGGSSRLNARRS